MDRVACYIRVSSQEQKLHGISLDAQRDKLKTYAEDHQLKIVGWYEDEGVSGRKLIKNRPALQRMLNDAHGGKFDRIIFIKLDRFFRSVAEYHECMKYISPVIWTATEEKYDLSTANGRAFVNMKLTIAELEADQTGERIKIVNDYKVKTGQPLSGALPLGFKIDNLNGKKAIIRDPDTEHIIKDLLDYFIVHQNKRKTMEYIKLKYSIHFTYNMLNVILSDTKLYGYYRGNDDYCESYIDKCTFDKIQQILKNNIKERKTNNIFIFSGLIRCPECNYALVGSTSGGTNVKKGKTYQRYKIIYHYRCNNLVRNNSCNYHKRINEEKLETQILDNLDQYITAYITAYITDVTINDTTYTADHDYILSKISEIKAEMKNTTTAFTKGRLPEVEYDRLYEDLERQLTLYQEKLEPVKSRDLSVYEELLKSNWKDIYKALTKENKRAFFRKYIKEIRVDSDGQLSSIIFF